MFIYKKTICRVLFEGKEVLVQMVTIRLPDQIIPSGCTCIGEILTESGAFELRKVGPSWTSLNYFEAEASEELFKLAESLLDQEGEIPEVLLTKKYFTGGGWWIDAVGFTAGEVVKKLKQEGYQIIDIG